MARSDYSNLQWTMEEDGYDSIDFQDRQTDSLSKSENFEQSESHIFKAEPMTVRVDAPQKNGSFVTYQLHTTTHIVNFSCEQPVRRRFRDFNWLYHALSVEFPASIIPPLPEKHRLKFIKGDRFDSMFLEQRRLGLQWFMNRIARHPYLQSSEYTRLFLESNDFIPEKTIQIKPTLTFSSFFKPTGKLKKPDERFERMKEKVERLQENLQVIERLYSKIGKQQQLLEVDYRQFASSIRELSGFDADKDKPVWVFTEGIENYVSAFKEQRQNEELLFLNDVHELLNYCEAAKEQLLKRDYKQIIFEEISADLQLVIFEREKSLNLGTHFDNVTDKMREMDKTRSEKIIRLEFKMEQLEQSLTKASYESNEYSEQIIKEFELFKQVKEVELKQSLMTYVNSHIDFYKKCISTWKDIMPLLDQI